MSANTQTPYADDLASTHDRADSRKPVDSFSGAPTTPVAPSPENRTSGSRRRFLAAVVAVPVAGALPAIARATPAISAPVSRLADDGVQPVFAKPAEAERAFEGATRRHEQIY